MSGNLRLFVCLLTVAYADGSASHAQNNLTPKPRGVEAWHTAGWKGKNITIAILDGGFRGYREQLGKTLPGEVGVRSFRDDGNLEAKESQHGILCAEVVHTIAPEARLLLANWEPDRPESFLKAVAWARAQGATIFSCSMIMPGWSDGLGGGDIHRQLAELLRGALFFASAGNLAERHWTGAFQDDGQGKHLWKPGRTENSIIPWGGVPISVEIVARNESTYRISLIDSHGRSISVPQPLVAPGVRGSTIRIMPAENQRYRIRLEHLAGSGGTIRLLVLGGDLEIATTDACMVFPGDGAATIAVGAVTNDGKRDPASATGWLKPTVKPDCVAMTPFPSRIRSAPFAGTSAAAPQAAGMAALLWSREPSTAANVMRERLLKNCRDVGPVGVDTETGHGAIQLPMP